MAEWRKRSHKSDDVIYFSYGGEGVLKKVNEAYLWDIDKTYLDTKFETIRGLLKTVSEKASQKKNIPGAAELVSSLKFAWQKRRGNDDLPIFFITASPPQMERKIREKLRLDGIHPKGIFCKDNLPNLWPRRFWRLNKQVGYKIQALLQLRSLLAHETRLIMFGDDGEADSIIYSLFSDICARRMDTSELRRVLNAFFVLDHQVDTIFRMRDELSDQDPVEKIYINLAEDTDADYYKKFGRRTVPTENSFQAALDLFQDGRLDIEHIVQIGRHLIALHGVTIEQMGLAFDDLIRREVLLKATCDKIIPILNKERMLPEDFKPSIEPVQTHSDFEPWIPERIDYLHDYR